MPRNPIINVGLFLLLMGVAVGFPAVNEAFVGFGRGVESMLQFGLMVIALGFLAYPLIDSAFGGS